MLTTISESNVPKGHAARRAWIRLRLAEKGFTLKSLSSRRRYSYTSLRQAMVRKKPKAERVIARAIGVPPAKIWPERYPSSEAR